jgi:hypothetical protein
MYAIPGPLSGPPPKTLARLALLINSDGKVIETRPIERAKVPTRHHPCVGTHRFVPLPANQVPASGLVRCQTLRPQGLLGIIRLGSHIIAGVDYWFGKIWSNLRSAVLGGRKSSDEKNSCEDANASHK